MARDKARKLFPATIIYYHIYDNDDKQYNPVHGAILAVNAITSNALAGGSVTFAKLNQNGCTDGQIMKWNITAGSWQCASDNTGTPTTYSAGTGLTMSANTISFDLSRANNWSGLQSFGSGLSVGGTTYTNLAGSGLSVTGGTLASTLGTSIGSSEILDGTISTADLAAVERL